MVVPLKEFIRPKCQFYNRENYMSFLIVCRSPPVSILEYHQDAFRSGLSLP